MHQVRCKNDPTSHFIIYYLRKQFAHEFIVSVATFKSSPVQHDVHYVNYDAIMSKIGDKAFVKHILVCRLTVIHQIV